MIGLKQILQRKFGEDTAHPALCIECGHYRATGRAVSRECQQRAYFETQAKMRRASQAWRDTRPHAPKAGSSPGRASEPLSEVAANSPICARSVRGTTKPR